jgi:hypothetical protein
MSFTISEARLKIIEKLLYQPNCFNVNNRTSAQTRKGSRSGTESVFEKGSLLHPVWCIDGDGTEESVIVDPIMLNISNRCLCNLTGCDVERVQSYVSQHTFETRCPQATFLFHTGRIPDCIRNAVPGDVFHTDNILYTHTDPEWHYDVPSYDEISRSKKGTYILECPPNYPVNNYDNNDSYSYYPTTESRYVYEQMIFDTPPSGKGQWSVRASFNVDVTSVSGNKIYTNKRVPLPNPMYQVYYKGEPVEILGFVYNFKDCEQFTHGFETTEYMASKIHTNDTLQVKARISVNIFDITRPSTRHDVHLRITNNHLELLSKANPKRGLCVTNEPVFIYIDEEEFMIKLHSDAARHTTIILPPSEFEFQGMSKVDTGDGKAPPDNCDTLIRLKIRSTTTTSPFQLMREIPSEYLCHTPEGCNAIYTTDVQISDDSKSYTFELYAWVRLQVLHDMNSISISRDFVRFKNEISCLQYPITDRQTFNSFVLEDLHDTTDTYELWINTKKYTCEINNESHPIVRIGSFIVDSPHVAHLQLEGQPEKMDDEQYRVRFKLPKSQKAFINLNVGGEQYLLSNMVKPNYSEHVVYAQELESGQALIGTFSIPPANGYDTRIAVYLARLDGTYTKIHMYNNDIQLCKDHKIGFTMIRATDNPRFQVFEENVIRMTIRFDESHLLVKRPHPSGRGNIYEIDKQNTPEIEIVVDSVDSKMTICRALSQRVKRKKRRII